MKKALAFSIIFILSGCMCVKAQDLVITGRVIDSNGSALPWTSIALKGDSTCHTKSDKDGKYLLNLKSIGNDTLTFSYIGYENQEVALNHQQTIDIILTKSNIDYSEIVAIAYGTRKKERVSPAEIPNAYKEDNSIEIPNAYRNDQDKSVKIPNTDSKDKIRPIPKLTPKFLPNPEK